MVRYLFYTIGDLTYQSPLVWCTVRKTSNNDNYLFVTKDTKTSSSQFLVTTSRKCDCIITNYLTHSETQLPVTSVSSFAALGNSMRVYAPSCFTFQHSKYHTTTMRGYFTASTVFNRKTMTPRSKRTVNKIQHVPLTDQHRRHQVQWHTTDLYTRETCAFHRKKNTHALRANYPTSDFSVQLFHTS